MKETGETVKQLFTDAADAIKQIHTAEARTGLASLGVALAEVLTTGIITQGFDLQFQNTIPKR